MGNHIARRTTIAPICFIEKSHYLLIGDKFVQVMTFWGFPQTYIEGLLAPFITSPDYVLDMVTEKSDLDFASLLKREREEYITILKKTKDPTTVEKINLRITVLDYYIAESVKTNSATINVICQLYIKADTKEELKDKVKTIRGIFGTGSQGIALRNISLIQQSLYKKNSAIFIKDGLRKEIDYANGRLMSSESVAGLWPWIFDTLEDRQGTLIGRELTTGGKVIFDQFAYINDPDLSRIMNRPSGNMIVIGRTGMGKTTLMNILIHGHVLNHRKIIWIDPENKNEKLCHFLGGNYISIGFDNNIINIFDLKPISTDSENRETRETMYSNKMAIFNVVEDIKITFKLLFPSISESALSMINEIVIKTYESVGINIEGTFEHLGVGNYPTFTNFTAVLKDEIEKRIKSNKENQYESEIVALKEIEMKMRQITGFNGVEGEYGRYFNGTTTISKKSLDDTGMIAIGTKHLFSVTNQLKNALLRLVFNYAWSLCLGHSEEQTVFVNDEQHMFISEPELANILAIFQRRARKYNTVTLGGTQEVAEYTNPIIITSGKAIFNNATYGLYMGLTKDGVDDLSKLISLSESEKAMLEQFDPYQGMLIVGKKHMPIEVLATPDEIALTK